MKKIVAKEDSKRILPVIWVVLVYLGKLEFYICSSGHQPFKCNLISSIRNTHYLMHEYFYVTAFASSIRTTNAIVKPDEGSFISSFSADKSQSQIDCL